MIAFFTVLSKYIDFNILKCIKKNFSIPTFDIFLMFSRKILKNSIENLKSDKSRIKRCLTGKVKMDRPPFFTDEYGADGRAE